MKEKFVMAYSCGKDSTLALYNMIKEGYEPVALLITGKDGEESWFHSIPKELIDKVSKSLNIPVIYIICNMKSYEEDFIKGLKIAKEKYGATICAFGDIDLELHKKWNLDMCKRAEIRGMLPLWKKDRKEVTIEFIKEGFKGIIKKVNLKELDKGFLGRILDKEVILDLENKGVDICGENGEYHTFVFDGPIFKRKINFEKIGIEEAKDYGHLKIK